ncbi:MAG: hypothetical protein ACFFCW_47085, partial [Candidatus Hodarchaeota archaeon]
HRQHTPPSRSHPLILPIRRTGTVTVPFIPRRSIVYVDRWWTSEQFERAHVTEGCEQLCVINFRNDQYGYVTGRYCRQCLQRRSESSRLPGVLAEADVSEF